MTSPTGIRPAVNTVRLELQRRRAALRHQHAAGIPAIQLCAQWAQVCDDSLFLLLEDALAELPEAPRNFALVAHGGYGRRDTAPFSDVDVMLLHASRSGAPFADLAKRFSRNIYDAGFQLGFSLRSMADCMTESLRDVRVLTSLLESRFLYGDQDVFLSFYHSFGRYSRRRANRFITSIIEARREERLKFGDTVYLLEPNIKRSRGALRDWQLVRWVGGVRAGTTDLEKLMRQGILTPDDYRDLSDGHEFLLGLRNELHFHADRAQDVLNRSEQLRIAAARGYSGTEAERPVEALMREYFAHTRAVRDASRHFCDTARPRSKIASALEPVVSHRVARDYLVGPVHIRARAKTKQRLTEDVGEVLRLMDLANWYARRIDHETWQVIRRAMRERDDLQLSPSAAKRFLSFLSHPARLGDLLRRLHELRVLELFVPAMRHAHCLVQFNEYHKYTVDEHCILAVQRVTEFYGRDDELGEAYRELQPKHLLHLALLLHDLGKGFPGDHSEIGGRLAEETGERLGLPARETAMLRALVEKHLLMSHLAQQHNIYDEATWLHLAREVGSPFMLQMLFLLTCADLAAVGPGVLNEWKLRLITELYLQTREHLTQDLGQRPAKLIARRKRAEVAALIEQQIQAQGSRSHTQQPQQWLDLLDLVPRQLLIADPPQQILELIERLAAAPASDGSASEQPTSGVVAWSVYQPKQRTVAYTVIAPESLVPGVFHRLTGALSSQGLQILSAEIFTIDGRFALDRFVVEDPDHDGQPPPERIKQICDLLRDSLAGNSAAPPKFRRLWGAANSQQRFTDLPVRIRFDNATSPECTIVSVFAYDRIGLLYDVAHTLFQLGLSVRSAKIGTHLDQVADVFYVVDEQGNKIRDEAKLNRIRTAIVASIGDESTNDR